VYASDSLAYNFDAALNDARRREKERAQRDGNEVKIAERIFWLSPFPEAPTPEGLRRHTERFGSDGVAEVAAVYGVDLTATTKPRTPKRLTTRKSKRAIIRARAVLNPEEVAA
jgi:hypothetical protein